ncbi:acyl-CoA dehydrogenase family protein [Sphingomonas sp. MMS12-HWE2-04]|uniref:acyl-CoA dehydrogenase family protein n=1 Tax=Sphingomonas sp. MMS12-HWE2-04 TaxID=3234199 RepID=UPI00384D8372
MGCGQAALDAAGWAEIAEHHVAPHAQRIDREACISVEVIDTLRGAGAFASGFPPALGGLDDDWLRHGRMHAALGAASASVQGLVNVHHMAGSAIARWGSAEQKQRWVPELSSGRMLGALAITEPEVGSDIAAVQTRATQAGAGWRIEGIKRWITCGQNADLFVVLANSDAGPAAFLLPRTTPGLEIVPIDHMLGCRGYMLAELRIASDLPGDHLLGRPGFGASHVVAAGLDAGRFNLAWGCVGLAQACLDAAIGHTRRRGLAEFQLVQAMVARMSVDVQAARLLCERAAALRSARDPDAIRAGAVAKYFASTMVNRVANDTLQLHGAQGCGPDLPVERWFRDARIMEIIEGSTQVLELLIARHAYQAAPR